MICRECRAAAEILRLTPGVLVDPVQSARTRHAQCRGGTWCDCQHKIPAKRDRGDG